MSEWTRVFQYAVSITWALAVYLQCSTSHVENIAVWKTSKRSRLVASVDGQVAFAQILPNTILFHTGLDLEFLIRSFRKHEQFVPSRFWRQDCVSLMVLALAFKMINRFLTRLYDVLGGIIRAIDSAALPLIPHSLA